MTLPVGIEHAFNIGEKHEFPACRANATPAAVSSPLTFSKVDSPTASVGITGTLPLLDYGIEEAAIRLDVGSNQSPGPAPSFCPDGSKHPNCGNACRLQGTYERRVHLSQQRGRDGVSVTSSVTRRPSMNCGFDVHPFQHARDLYAAPMHDGKPVPSPQEMILSTAASGFSRSAPPILTTATLLIEGVLFRPGVRA